MADIYSLELTNVTDRIYSTVNITQDDIDFHYAFYKITVPVLYGLITLTGLVGNLLVIFVILSKHKMRTTVNILLLNLAFSDIILLSLCVPFVTYHYSADNWDIAEFFCKLWQYVLYDAVYVTVYTLVSISIVRFLTIVYPQKTVLIKDNHKVIILIMIIWMVMCSVNIPIIYSYKVKHNPLFPGYRYCSVENGKVVHLTFFIFTYIVPFCIITTSYILLLRFLALNRKHSTLRQSNRSQVSEKRGKERTTMASRILLIVVAVFGFCWLPLHIVLLLGYLGKQPQTRGYEIFRVLAHCLAYGNSCMNPIIYNYVSKDFRTRFKGIWHSCSKVTFRRGSSRQNSHMLNTFDYKNENATMNGGTPPRSAQQGSGQSPLKDIHHETTIAVKHSLENNSSVTDSVPEKYIGENVMKEVELLFVTKTQDNGVPVTDV